MKLTVIIPTVGRDTVWRAARSAGFADEIIIVRDQTGDWGATPRNQTMHRAAGDYLLFLDDDDVYTTHAGDVIRQAIEQEPDRVHVFCMAYPDGQTVGRDRLLELGYVGTPMFVVPNQPGRLGVWSDRYEADFDFIADTVRLRQEEPVWHDDVICLIRPQEDASGDS